jgi:hypothetical protein
MRRQLALVAFLLLVTFAGRSDATSAGPQPGTTGVPAGGGFAAEMTCTSCHGSSPLNADGAGRLELRGLPAHYTPGARYSLTFTLSHSDPAVRGWGFQLTAVGRTTLAGAGEFVATDAKTTQVMPGDPGGRQYVEHTYGGMGAGKTGSNSWTFEWVAPAHDVGDVAFFAAGNAANLDGSKEGDRIYSRSPEPLAVVHGPGGGDTGGAASGETGNPQRRDAPAIPPRKDQ